MLIADNNSFTTIFSTFVWTHDPNKKYVPNDISLEKKNA